MQVLSSIEAGAKLRVQQATHHTPTSPPADAQAASVQGLSPAGYGKADSKFRLGDVVHHGRFGPGRVLAHWPDGTVMVRFDRLAKNRLVWPAFLNGIGG